MEITKVITFEKILKDDISLIIIIIIIIIVMMK